MAPVLSFVVEPLVEHLHDFDEIISIPNNKDKVSKNNVIRLTDCKSFGPTRSSGCHWGPMGRCSLPP